MVALAVEHIGKEANRWVEQYYLGLDLVAQTEYATSPEDCEQVIGAVAKLPRSTGGEHWLRQRRFPE
jgi:hypothetical protein